MMENYFIVLQLPESKELRFTQGNSTTHNFWGRAANAISNGKAKIISLRKDTGVSEDIRLHSEQVGEFKTYVLVNVGLKDNDKNEAIFAKAAKCIALSNTAAVIETTPEFQLLAIGA